MLVEALWSCLEVDGAVLVGDPAALWLWRACRRRASPKHYAMQVPATGDDDWKDVLRSTLMCRKLDLKGQSQPSWPMTSCLPSFPDKAIPG